MILHSRRTHDKLAQYLRRHDLPRRGVVHGFSGSLQQAQRFIALGYKIGVGGTITYPRASKTRDVMAQPAVAGAAAGNRCAGYAAERFSGPAKSPGTGGARNVFEVLCQLRPEPPDEIADALWHNSLRLFALPE